MKKYMFLFLFLVIPVNAKITYLISDKTNITNNDNYESYIIDKNNYLYIDKEHGILSNDIYKDGNIIVLESSNNSHLKDLVINEDGSFIYTPSSDVVGIVEYKYFIKDDNNSNISTISFYINNTIVDYTINYYCNNELIVPSIVKKASVNSFVTEYPTRIDGYYLIDNNPVTKQINNEDNNFNFYYVSYIDRVNTGI